MITNKRLATNGLHITN